MLCTANQIGRLPPYATFRAKVNGIGLSKHTPLHVIEQIQDVVDKQLLARPLSLSQMYIACRMA